MTLRWLNVTSSVFCSVISFPFGGGSCVISHCIYLAGGFILGMIQVNSTSIPGSKVPSGSF